MKNIFILSTRHSLDWPSYHLIYEWEDFFSSALGLPIISSQSTQKMVSKPLWKKIINKINNKLTTPIPNNIHDTYNLFFELSPSFSIPDKTIPIIVDFWKQTNLDDFYRAYKRCPIVLISSLEVFQYLKENDCPLNIVHFPLSLPDKYALTENENYEKKYDIIFAGRYNELLMQYMNKFTEKFTGTNFLYQKEINGKLFYTSNKGQTIGEFHSRSEYISLIKSCKISFYSTPGIDGGEIRTGGFNPVTPRFLELLSAQCMIMGRYPKNAETEFYELEKVCPNIDCYEEFEDILLMYLKDKFSRFTDYHNILSKHYTSNRAEELKLILTNFSQEIVA